LARLFGFIGNRAELGAKVLSAYAEYLETPNPQGQALGWGVGFYQFGEVLLRRRPLDERERIEPARFAENLKTDVLIGHVRHPTVGKLRTENTHPFRYRQWLFAQTGTMAGFEKLRERLQSVQPAFLKPNVRGDTDSELFFYLVLSCLHDQGRLEQRLVAVEHVREALRTAIGLVDRLCVEHDLPTHRGDILMTDGESMIGVNRTGKMAYRVVDDMREIEALLSVDLGTDATPQNLAHARCCVLASEIDPLPAGWERAAADSFLWASRTQGPQAEPIAVAPI
jgi:predicted glutamine amidotransferase